MQYWNSQGTRSTLSEKVEQPLMTKCELITRKMAHDHHRVTKASASSFFCPSASQYSKSVASRTKGSRGSTQMQKNLHFLATRAVSLNSMLFLKTHRNRRFQPPNAAPNPGLPPLPRHVSSFPKLSPDLQIDTQPLQTPVTSASQHQFRTTAK